MRIGALIFALLLPSVSYADTLPTPDPKLCETFARAEYQAGIDVNGDEVVPADLNAPLIEVPQEIKVPLTINLKHYLKADTSALGQMDATLGTLTIKGNEVYLDDKLLTNDQTKKLEALCE